MINTVISEGYLTRKPELKTTKNGKYFCSFTLGLNRRVPKGHKGQAADFPSYIAYEKSAEFLCQYGDKGSLVSVQGRLSTRNYDGQDGRKVYVTEVICSEVNLLKTESKAPQEIEVPFPDEEPKKEEIVIDTEELPFY